MYAAVVSTWWEYVQQHAPGVTQNGIAAAMNINPGTLSKWKGTGGVSAESVIAFARAYQRPPIEALIVAGLLRTEEVRDIIRVTSTTAADLSPEELIREVWRRMNEPQPRDSALPRLKLTFEQLGVERPDQKGKKRG